MMSPLLILALVAMFGLGLLFLLSKPRNRHKNRGRSATAGGLGRRQFIEQWQRIAALMHEPGTDGMRHAILEADKLLDIALRQGGYPGDTLGQRLRSAERDFAKRSSYQGLWEAHKMRNALAHELGFDIPRQHAQHILRLYEDGLRELNVL
jgi:hypothetical protein